MKTKKWMALILTLTMLLGMMPAALAVIGTGWDDDCRANISGGLDPAQFVYGKHHWEMDVEVPGNSCTSAGTARYTCSYCGARISRQTAAPGHKWGEWIVTKQATCRETGLRYHVCAVCGEKQYETIPVNDNHSYGGWTVTEEPTCKTAGSHWRKCSVCGHKQTETLRPAHKWGEWEILKEATCKENGSRRHVCTVCGETETETLKANRDAHMWGEWEITQEATCKRPGSRKQVCSECGFQKTQRIEKLEHDWGDWVVTTPATCKQMGLRYRVCGACGERKDERIKTAEHTWGEWKITRPATCQQRGLRERVCSVCGNKNTERTPKADHDWGKWDITKHPTCQTEGARMRVCAVCRAKQTERIDKTDHRWGEWKIIKPTTKDAPGIRENTCLECGATMQEELRLQLTVDNLHRSGADADEVFTFDMTVTNRTGGWSLISASARRDAGSLTDQEGFANWPEGELLLSDEHSHSFSYHFRPTAKELENAKNGSGPSTISRTITVLDREGNTGTVQLVAQLRHPGAGLAFLEGSMDFHGRSNLWRNDSDSFPVTLTLTNVGDVPLTDPVAHCTLMTSGGKTLRTITLQPESGAASFRPGESVPFTMTAQVDGADVAEALKETSDLQWVFWAEYGYMSAAGEAASGESNLWRQGIKVWDLEAGDPRGTLVLPILTGSFEDRVYHPGETVWIDLTVENVNPTETFKGIRFERYGVNGQSAAAIEMPDLTLKPGESYTLEHRFSVDVDSEAAKKGYYILDFVAWCRHPSYEWYSNAGWSGVVHMAPDEEGGLSVEPEFDFGNLGKIDVFKDDTVFYYLPSNQSSGGIILTVSNGTDKYINASITSDHPGDAFDGEPEKEIPLPAGKRRMVNFTFTPTEEEKQAGRLTRTVTASTPDGALQGGKTLSFALRSGSWGLETDRPGLSVQAGSVCQIGSGNPYSAVFRADVTVVNTGGVPLSLSVESQDGRGWSTPADVFDGWGDGVDVTHFQPGESFTFRYIMSEAEKEGSDGFMRRTLNVRGAVPDSDICVTDSASFCFPMVKRGALRLTVDGHHRSGDPDQAITAYLTLQNVFLSEETVTVSIAAKDAHGNAPSGDQMIEWPQGGSVTLGPWESYSFGYVIHPTQDEILANKVERTVTADGGREGFVSSVSLSYPLISGAGGVAILHLEGEMQYASPLPLYDSFKAHLTAKNMGEETLENVLFHGMAQSADGKCVAQITLGASDGGTATTPGQALQCFPAFPVTAEMAAAALSAHCVNEFGEAGTLTFTFHASYTYRTEDGQAVPGVSNMLTYTVPVREEKTGGIDLSGMRDSQPYPTAGDTVTVHLTIRNVGEEDLTGLRLEMQRMRQHSFIPEKNLIDEPKDQVFHAGETRTCDFAYTVTPQDVEAGAILALKFIASAENSAKQQIYVSRWEMGQLLAGSETPETPDMPDKPDAADDGGAIVISKRIDGMPPNGQIGFRLNDAIHYTIELTNTYDFPVTNIAVYDDMTGYSPVMLGAVDLESGQSKTLSFTHPVTAQDVEMMSVVNSAYALVMVNDPTSGETLEDYTVSSNEVVARVEDSGEDEEEALTVIKTVVGTSENPNGYREGETIQYDIAVHNGHQTGIEVNVEDWVSGTDAPVPVAQVTLAPGETKHYAFSYTVCPDDVSAGVVINYAYAAMVMPSEDGALVSGYTVWSPSVAVPVLPSAGNENTGTTHVDPPATEPPVTVAPLIPPETVTPEPVPTESVTPGPVPPGPVPTEPVTPRAVTPDVSPAPKSGSFCRRVLTGMGSGKTAYELAFCGRHLSVELSAREMTDGQAKTLWTDAVNEGYDALAAKYPGNTAALINTERSLFFDQLAAFETVAAAREGEEKALARVAEQLRVRCLDLCYALHTAPEQRLDSAPRDGIPSISEEGDMPDKCLMESEETPFGSRVKYHVCREHLFAREPLNSAGDAADAFRKSKALWQTALMEVVSALHREAALEEKDAVADSQNLFHQWLNARQNVLTALYPGDEATVMEVMSFTIQNRVFDLEGIER